MKRIIYIDFDGTLLADDRSLPEVNRQCLKRLLSEGHILAFNTGRSIKSGMGLIKGFGLSDPNIYLLSFQGNMIYHPAEEKVLYESGIERNDGVELLKKVNSMGIYCHTYNDEGLLTIEDMSNENLKKYVEITGEPVAYIDSWEEVKTPTINQTVTAESEEIKLPIIHSISTANWILLNYSIPRHPVPGYPCHPGPEYGAPSGSADTQSGRGQK